MSRVFLQKGEDIIKAFGMIAKARWDTRTAGRLFGFVPVARVQIPLLRCVWRCDFNTKTDYKGASDKEQAITMDMPEEERVEILRNKTITPCSIEIHEDFNIDWEALEKK